MMEPQNNAEQVNRNTATATLGAMLREARERLGLSVEDVAAQTKFAPRQIEALEADDFKHLPEPAFLRGFVRSYAKILNLDAQPLLAALPQEKATIPELIPPSVEMPYPIGNNSQKQNLILLGAALLLAVLAVGFSVWHFTTPRQTPAEKLETPVPLPAPKEAITEPLEKNHNASESSAPAEQKRQSPAVTESKRQTAATPEPKRQPSATVAQSSVRAARTGTSGTAAQSSVRAAKTKGKTKAVSAAQSAVPQSSVRAAKTKAVQAEPRKQTTDTGNTDEGPTTMLRLVFDEESWTEITDRDGKMISSQINPRGSELNVHGHLPLSLVIGHAASTHLYKDGKPVDITPFINSTSDVARVTVE